ncbi:ECF transporter S component [Methanosphaerula subterraneus]|uniref:ECF transporter S component n=1 Tax=Methanosphaerula subterraneus TaxID=3350244 RepID=UPI003F852D26
MSKMSSYFSLYEIALLSLLGAMVFVLNRLFEIPLHVPGSSGIWWVIPVIIGARVVRKPGAGIYIGLISGILASFFGNNPLHIFDLFKYLALGMAIDLTALVFGYQFTNPLVGFIAGVAGNMAKMVVNYAVQFFFGVQAHFILLGIGIASATHLIFGGIGGVIAALVLRRLLKAGVIGADEST